MKTISIQVIQPGGASTVPNEIIAEKVMGWRLTGYRKLTVTMDSGQEYEVGGTAEDFKRRLKIALEVPAFDPGRAVPEINVPEIDSEIAMAELLYETIQACDDRATGVDAIVNRFDELQKQHCKNSHFGECLT